MTTEPEAAAAADALAPAGIAPDALAPDALAPDANRADASASECVDAEAPDGTRYDELAESYVRHWAPVLREAALGVLDQLAPEIEAADGRELRLLDVGAGTGMLSLAALRRWRNVRVTGIDPSAGMLEVARRTAAEELAPEAAARFRTAVASAEELPDDLGRFDAAMSSFVLQLVRNRTAALRAVHRVLVPGAPFAWVSWLRTDRPFEPDRIANEVLDDFGFDPPEPGDGPDDFASVNAAAAVMRKAGFHDIRAWPAETTFAWDPEGYLGFLTEFDEASLFDDLDADERADIEGRILDGLRGLTPDDLTLCLPVVYVTGRTPA
ncbi:MAG TPA: class I SAM-dependent methyltransferase [Candidatus Binatia bacterium]|nr:class I SAM-dependent methyltransferase [Candidatus Binatia bacterium]